MSAVATLARIRADFGEKAGGSFGGLGNVGALEPAPVDGSDAAKSEGTSEAHANALKLGWPELDALLPEGALPGGVIELSSRALSASAIAVRAVQAVHRREKEAWCAWLDPEGTLYAPGLASAGIDLTRLLVAAPARGELGRVALKMTQSGAFDLVVIDMDPVPGAVMNIQKSGEVSRRRDRAWPSDVLVRKLSLAVEDGKTQVLLLTDCTQPRVTSWPVAMRLDVARRGSEWQIAIGKERRGRLRRSESVPLLGHHVSTALPLALAKTATTIAKIIVPTAWVATQEPRQTG